MQAKLGPGKDEDQDQEDPNADANYLSDNELDSDGVQALHECQQIDKEALKHQVQRPPASAPHSRQGPLLHWNIDTGICTYGGRKVCRETLIKSNSISMYCYLHGCARVLTTKKYPPRAAVDTWVVGGVDLPAGKAGRKEHLQQWEAMMAANLDSRRSAGP